MQIGQAAKASGVSAKMIRHYEAIGLVPAADRRGSNYREYSDEDVHRLAFIRRARDLGFSLEQIADLLKLWADKDRSNAEVKAMAMAHVRDLEAKARHLQDMAGLLLNLADACEGDGRPTCPIISDLEGSRRGVGPALHRGSGSVP